MDNYNSWKEKMPENVQNSALLGEKSLTKGATDRRDSRNSETSGTLTLSRRGWRIQINTY